jgi:cyclase
MIWEQAPGGWCLNNAGVVVGDDHVVLVDTAATRRRAELLRGAVNGLGAGPVRTIINTHFHGDHTFGNSVFPCSTTIVAHEHMREEMIAAGLALTHLWPDVDWGVMELRPPDLTFADRLTMHIGGREIELLHYGPAHTRGDTLVWMPAERVLFTGDIILSGATPFTLMGSVMGTLTTLDSIRDLDPQLLVTGHGPVCGPEALDVTERYLRRIQQLAEQGAGAGLSPLEVARTAGPGEFADLIDPERLVGTLHRAYAELEPGLLGRELDVMRAFAEMIDYNNGKLPTCVA